MKKKISKVAKFGFTSMSVKIKTKERFQKQMKQYKCLNHSKFLDAMLKVMTKFKPEMEDLLK